MLVLGGDRREQNAGGVKSFVLSRLADNFAVANSTGMLSTSIHVGRP